MKEKERGERERERASSACNCGLGASSRKRDLPLFLTSILGEILQGSHRYTEETGMFGTPVIRKYLVVSSEVGLLTLNR